METKLPKQLYYKDDNFTLEVEPIDGEYFLHCIVQEWNASVLRRMYKVFAVLLEEANQHGVERMYTVTPNPRFAKLFGGTTIGHVEIDNVLHEVIIWEKV
jgi:hypothetical protein